jgi:hypothetical protein
LAQSASLLIAYLTSSSCTVRRIEGLEKPLRLEKGNVRIWFQEKEGERREGRGGKRRGQGWESCTPLVRQPDKT